VVLLNAGAALCVDSGDFRAGIAQAAQAIDSGRALALLDAWVAQTQAMT
jgi:anthranilate phosphoribosyltransferase